MSGDFRYIWRLLTERLGVPESTGPDLPPRSPRGARRSAAFMLSLKTWDEVEAAFAKMNVAWGQVRPAANVREQATLAHRGSIVEVDDRAGGTRPIAQSPYRWSSAKSGVKGPAPHRGEHNREVLGEWLGLSEAEVESLGAAGVVLRDEATTKQPSPPADERGEGYIDSLLIPSHD